MFVVYVLRSLSTGKLYIGQTRNLVKHLKEHNTGAAQYTRNRGPWVLLLQEDYPTRSDAMKRERYLKTGKGREWLGSNL